MVAVYPLALSADIDLSDERSTPNMMCNDRLAGESGTRARFFESFVRDESRAAGRMVRGIGGGVSGSTIVATVSRTAEALRANQRKGSIDRQKWLSCRSCRGQLFPPFRIRARNRFWQVGKPTSALQGINEGVKCKLHQLWNPLIRKGRATLIAIPASFSDGAEGEGRGDA